MHTAPTPAPPTHLPSYSSGAAGPPPPPPPSKHVKLPEFNGMQNVKGFLAVFKLGYNQLQLDVEGRKVSLAGRLTGAAASWLQGQEDRLRTMSYMELREGLLEHCAGEVSAHVRVLQRLKQQKLSLAEHNAKFSASAAAAASFMTPMWQKELYVESLANLEVQRLLRAFQHLGLQ
jgi:hypothetical protein